MYNAEESKELRCKIALELARFKALKALDEGCSHTALTFEDVNEIFTVAGIELIVPKEVDAKEINVIDLNKEDEE